MQEIILGKNMETYPCGLALLLADVDPVAGVVLLHLHRLHLLLDRLHVENSAENGDGGGTAESPGACWRL